jgi:hypothetical protein
MKQYGAKRKDSAVCTCCGTRHQKNRARKKRARQAQERERDPVAGSWGDPLHQPDDYYRDFLKDGAGP